MPNTAPTATIRARKQGVAITGELNLGGLDQPELTRLSNGNFVAVWRSFFESNPYISYRLFTAAGQPITATARASATGYSESATEPHVLALADGKFAVTYIKQGPSYGPVVQMFAADGTKLGGEIFASSAGGSYPEIASLPNGNIVVTWFSYGARDGSGSSIHAQIIGADGSKIGGEILVNSATLKDQFYPQVTVLAGGKFVISWSDGSGGVGGAGGDSSDSAIKGQIFNTDGSRSGGEFLVNTTTFRPQEGVEMVALADGGFATTWRDYSAGYAQIRGRVFDANGLAYRADVLISTLPNNAHSQQQMVALANGGWAVSWVSAIATGSGDADASGTSVRVRVYDWNGQPVTDQILVNTRTAGSQGSAASYDGNSVAIAVLSGDRFVVVFPDQDQIKAQLFSATGQRIGEEVLVDHFAGVGGVPQIDVVATGPNAYAVSWTERSSGFRSNEVHTRSFSVEPGFETYVQQALDLKGTLEAGDADSAGNPITVTLSVSFGVLNVSAGTSGAVVANSGTASVTIAGTLAQVNALLRTDPTSVVSYNSNFASPPVNANLSFQVTDSGTADGAPLSSTSIVPITLNVDAAPVVTPGAGSAAFVESGTSSSTPILVAPSLTVSDADNATLKSAMVKITGGFQPGQDALSLPGGNPDIGDITGTYNASTGTLTLSSASGVATMAQWQAALRAVRYDNNSDVPDTTTRTVTFTVNDGIVDSIAASRSVTVTATNDAPTVDLNGADAGADRSVGYRTNTSVFIAPNATINDFDSADFAGGQLSITYLSGADAANRLSIFNQGNGAGRIGVVGNAVFYGGVQIGTYSGGDGINPMAVQLNANADTAAVQALLRDIQFYTYARIDSDRPALQVTLFDGDGGTSPARTASLIAPAVIITSNGGADAITMERVEGSSSGYFVASINAVLNTGEPPEFVTYSIVRDASSPDAARFSIIDRSVGQLTFNFIPDFERPSDADFGNDYVVTVRASSAGYADDFQTFTVRITNGPEKSAFTYNSLWTTAGPGSDGIWHVGDMNGDGRADLFRTLDNNAAQTFLSSGKHFTFNNSAPIGTHTKWLSGDFNGDGYGDVAFTDNPPSSPATTGVFVTLSTSAGYGANTTRWTTETFGPNQQWLVGDFNGDRRDDLLKFDDNGVVVLTSNGAGFQNGGNWSRAGSGSDGTWHVGDFNGDGRADIMRSLDGAGVQVFLSNGTGFTQSGTWTPAGAGSDGRWYVGDFDGDGKDDLLRHLSGTGNQVFLSTGSAFASAGVWSTATPGAMGFFVGDFTGDGAADLARLAPNGGVEVIV